MATTQLIYTIVMGGNTYTYHPGNDILTCCSHQPGSRYLLYEVSLTTGETFITNIGPTKHKIEPSDCHLDKLRSICQQLDTIRV